MKMSHKKNYLFSFLRFGLKCILFSISFYFLIVVIGGYLWISDSNEGKSQTENQDEVEIYITSNGFHTDIVIPIPSQTNIQIPFFESLKKDSISNSYLKEPNLYKWLSIGWGDKGFYNESYNGNFPTVFSCLNAALLPSPTLMHLDFYKNDLRENKDCKKIKLKRSEYDNLLQHIMSSFRTINKNEFTRLPQKGYSTSDYFFEAKGSYHLFYTCNSWTNEGLKKANQKTAHFAPFAQTILYHLN